MWEKAHFSLIISINRILAGKVKAKEVIAKAKDYLGTSYIGLAYVTNLGWGTAEDKRRKD